jgi:hypothetical protein
MSRMINLLISRVQLLRACIYKRSGSFFILPNGYSPEPDEGNISIIGNITITGGTCKYAAATGILTFLITANINSPAGANS